MTAESFKQLINEALKDSECLLCLKTRLENLSGKCECGSQYKSETRNFKLFVHSVKHHHPVGEVVNNNLNSQNICILGCLRNKSFTSNQVLLGHIVTKHICKWIEEDHLKNHSVAIDGKNSLAIRENDNSK